MTRWFSGMQQFGRALMLPIAVLPIAGLLLRLGQPDLLDLPAVAAAGQAIFSNLGILFAIGIAVGLARENHGAAGLAAVVCYFVATRGAEVLAEVPAGTMTKLSVPAGLLSGYLAGVLYNRYSEVKLPSYLAFFGGRRFVPIVAGVAGLILAAAFGFGWPALESGMDSLSRAVLGSGEAGLFVYGVLNRILIITGLHHVLNNLAWFLVGDYGGVTGDLNRFFAGDPSAGVFMSGFFPVMMFGLPAACLAMYHAADRARRRAVGGLLLSMALTSFLTGVTEPIEFTFVFLAPALYALHAVLTGTAMVLMDLLGVRLGFGFSAGLFDYLLNYGKATQPLLMLPVGMLYFALYYFAFRFVIARFDLKTPGREAEETATAGDNAGRIGRGGFFSARPGRRRQHPHPRCLYHQTSRVGGQPGRDRRSRAEAARRAGHHSPDGRHRAGRRRPDRGSTGRRNTPEPAQAGSYRRIGSRRRLVARGARRNLQRDQPRSGLDPAAGQGDGRFARR